MVFYTVEYKNEDGAQRFKAEVPFTDDSEMVEAARAQAVESGIDPDKIGGISLGWSMGIPPADDPIMEEIERHRNLAEQIGLRYVVISNDDVQTIEDLRRPLADGPIVVRARPFSEFEVRPATLESILLALDKVLSRQLDDHIFFERCTVKDGVAEVFMGS